MPAALGLGLSYRPTLRRPETKRRAQNLPGALNMA
jgi:hypothetical protein